MGKGYRLLEKPLWEWMKKHNWSGEIEKEGRKNQNQCRETGQNSSSHSQSSTKIKNH